MGNRQATLLLVPAGAPTRATGWTAERCAAMDVIALEHRGTGDSEWVADGNYSAGDMVYDVAQLVHQLDLAPVTIVAHSMGGNVCLRYAGIYPQHVRKLVAIEGLGPSPAMLAKMAAKPYAERIAEWIEKKRASAARTPRKYPTIEDALARMREENTYLTADQARHLTIHGSTQ